jgi:hypothetical protein
MTRVLLVVAALALALTGCKSESESVMSDMVAKQKEFLNILKSVKDKDSAVAAKAKLTELGKELDALTTKMSKLKIEASEQEKLAAKYKPEVEQIQKDLFAEMSRISQIPGAADQIFDGLSGTPNFGGLGHRRAFGN